LSEYDDIVEGDLPHFEVSDISFNQTIQAPLTPTDTATLSGNRLEGKHPVETACRPRLHE
jgi:hypothetical protein